MPFSQHIGGIFFICVCLSGVPGESLSNLIVKSIILWLLICGIYKLGKDSNN